tara:strand:+ start:6763 stop:7953 length:1191 start_codon:yes stop_codon:yes gene_type:complete
MSNLLNESIVDAKALRESALKNAESVVIEKYADEVKKTLENLLEQDELDLAAEPTDAAPEASEVVEEQSDDVPLAATDGLAENEGVNLDSIQTEGEDVEVTLDLGALKEAIDALSNELDEEIDISLDEEEDSEESDFPDLTGDGKVTQADILKGRGVKLSEDQEEDLDEEIEVGASAGEQSAEETEASEKQFNSSDDGGLTERLLDAVMEKLSADMGAELSGWAGRPTSQLQYEKERQLAQEASTESEEEATLEEEEQELNESNNLENVLENNENLKEELAKYQSALEGLKENLYDVNLSNARLLYTNRVLRNTSLNERQKEKIVEAISGAGSVTEAKTIFETLQSTVEAKPTRSPQSLSEAISSRSSVLTASRKETKATSQDPFADRMRRLAGIK